MPLLSVVCGPFQPVLEQAFLKSLSQPSPGPGRALAVAAPSRRMADRLQLLASREAGLTLLNVRFHTFHSLALEILADAGEERTPVADEFVHDRIIDDLLRAGTPFGRLTRRFAASARATLRDIAEAGVEPASVREHFAELFNEEDRVRLWALLDLQEKYQARLERAGLLAPSDAPRRAAALAEGSPALGRYAEILYYGFYDLNGVQADFFRAVSRAAPVRVFYPYLPGREAFRFADRFFQIHLQHGARAPERGEGSREGRALGPALDALFEPGLQAPLKDPGALRIINASGRRDEVWRAAKEILRLRREPGAPPFHEIGVVARSLEPYRSLVSEIFTENAIPFSGPDGDPLLRHPLAKIALSLLTLRRRQFPAAAVLEAAGSPYFRAGPARRFAGDWRRLVEKLGVRSGWPVWEGKLEAALQNGDLRGPAASLREFLGGLHADLEPRRGTWTELAARAREVLEKYLEVPEGSERVLWESVLGALAETGALDRALPPTDWDSLLEAFEEKLERSALPAPEGNPGVRVLGAMDARGENFRVLLLLGLEEGFFPRRVREDPLLSDAIRSRLQQPAGYWVLPKAAGHEEERLLFTLLAASVSERLIALYPRSDEEGKARVPSGFLRELCRACGLDLETASVEHVPRQPLAKLESAPLEDLTPKEVSHLLAARGQDPGPFRDLLGPEIELLQRGLERAPLFNRRGEPGPLDGLVDSPGDYGGVLRKRGISPTAMDSFARCPFQFYAERVLGLARTEEPAQRGHLPDRVRGKIYHRALELFYRRPPAGGWQALGEEEKRSRLEAALEGTYREFGGRELGVYPLLWESLRRGMSGHLDRFLSWDLASIRESGLAPAALEAPLSAELEGGGGLKIFGTIDRVDMDPAGLRLRVVDYKTRRRREGLEKRVLSLRAHQPFFYLELARAAHPGREADGAAYYFIEEADPTPQVFSAQAWRDARPALLRNTARLLDLIEHGRFFIAPDEGRGGACEYCSYSFVCRKAHPASRRRADGSALRAQWDGAHQAGPEERP